MVIFRRLNFISLIPGFLISLITRTYYIELSRGLEVYAYKYLLKLSTLKPMRLNCEHIGEPINYCNYGHTETVYRQSKEIVSDYLIEQVERYFLNITSLSKKIRIAHVSSFDYSAQFAAYLFRISQKRKVRLYFIHTNILTFIHRFSGAPDIPSTIHIYFPAEELEFCVKLFASVFLRLVRRERIKNNKTLLGTDSVSEKVGDTAVVFHQSMSYGSLFQKQHYFAESPGSRLSPQNVTCFVLDRVPAPPLLKTKNSVVDSLIDLRKTPSWSVYINAAFLLIYASGTVRCWREVLGIVYLTKFYLAYASWRNTIRRYPRLKNVIVDYDMLFPKGLALALESDGVRTIALQERGQASFAAICGTVIDTYLYAGRIFYKYGEEGRSIACRVPINFGQWRLSFFFDDQVPLLGDLEVCPLGVKKLAEFSTIIGCLGWFTDDSQANIFPYYSSDATVDYIARIKSAASNFSEAAFVLRFKILTALDRELVNLHCAGINNIFLLDDYSVPNASYSLCRDADVIISLSTSLADESLAFGKKVIYVDQLLHLDKICSGIYPKDYGFLMTSSTDEMLTLLGKCLSDDEEVIANYARLKNLLMGDADLSRPNVISSYLESCLQ